MPILPPSEILKPLCGLAGLYAIVWVKLYKDRFAEIGERKIQPEQFTGDPAKRVVLKNVDASDNFKNLFEVPTLFTTFCLSLAATNRVTPGFVKAAWGYVALRAVHSGIQTTVNKIPARFGVYAVSTVLLFRMWGKLATDLWA